MHGGCSAAGVESGDSVKHQQCPRSLRQVDHSAEERQLDEPVRDCHLRRGPVDALADPRALGPARLRGRHDVVEVL